MGSARGLHAIALCLALGCSVERIDLASRDAGGADVVFPDMAFADASADVAPDAGARLLSCDALGDFQGVLPAARDDREPPRIFFGEATVLARGSDFRTGTSMVVAGDRIWWGDGVVGCGGGTWRLRTWAVPLDPDLRADVAPRCEGGTRSPALVPESVFNGNVLTTCFTTHPIPRALPDGGTTFGDYRVECGALSLAGGAGTWTRTLPPRPGVWLQMAGISRIESGDVPEVARQSVGLAYTMEDSATRFQMLRYDGRPLGDSVELPDAPRDVKAVVFRDRRWWILRATTGDLAPDEAAMDIVRVNLDGTLAESVAVPAEIGRGLRPAQGRAEAAYGGVAMLSLTRPEALAPGRVDYLFACGDAVVARRTLRDDITADGVAWVPTQRGWVVFIAVAAPPGGNPAIEAIALDARGVQRGDPVRIEERGSVAYLRAVPGASGDDIWIVYVSATEGGESGYKLRQVRVREAR